MHAEREAAGGSFEEGRVWTWLFNPFHYVAGMQALVAGLVVIAATGLLAASLQIHQDGVLDLHFGKPVPTWFFVAQGFVDWAVLAAAALVAGVVASRSRFRAIDVLGTLALSRVPMLFATAGLPGLRLCPELMGRSSPEAACSPASGALFLLAAGVTFLALAWHVALIYRAIAVSCNVAREKGIVVFVVTLVVAEILSKIVLLYSRQLVQ
jgi:hypothetical protein